MVRLVCAVVALPPPSVSYDKRIESADRFNKRMFSMDIDLDP